MKKLVYVAGKFTGKTPEEEIANTEYARSYALTIWKMGFLALVPHLMTGIRTTREAEALGVTYERVMQECLRVVECCDVVFALPNYHQSKGARREIGHATRLGIPVVYHLSELLS